MPNNFLNAAGSFGEGFFKTLQYEKEQEDKRKQAEKEFGLKTREMNLLNAYRLKALEQDQSQFGAKLGQDQSQFDIGIDFKNRSLLQDQSQFDTSMKFKQDEADRDFDLNKKKIGLGYAQLNLDKKKLDLTKTQPSRSDVDQRQVEELFGKAKGYLDENKSGVAEDKYSGWKNDASSTTTQLLEKVGVPINGEVTNYIRSVIEDGDTPEQKRELLNEAINELYSKQAITDEQKRALQLWKELGTR